MSRNPDEMARQALVRPARPEDAAAIAAVLEQSFRDYKPAYTDDGYAATTPTGRQIRARLAEGPVWVALLRGAVVGTVAAVSKPSGIYVRSMAVAPSARGNRIGELLLQQVEDFARAQGASHLVLSTTPFLERAIRLYERWGFRRSDAGPHDLFGTPLFTMQKELPPSGEAGARDVGRRPRRWPAAAEGVGRKAGK